MTKQYFQDTVSEPMLANQAAITAITITTLYPTAQFTAIPAWDLRPGKIYIVKAGGTLTTGISGTLTITPRWGAALTVMGASQAQTTTVSLTTQPWYLEYYVVCRTVGAAGANSTVIGTGHFHCAGTVATAGGGWTQTFGGTSTAADNSLSTNAIDISVTFSIAPSMVVEYVFMQTPN